jgi:hypothetical protein
MTNTDEINTLTDNAIDSADLDSVSGGAALPGATWRQDSRGKPVEVTYGTEGGMKGRLEYATGALAGRAVPAGALR